MVSVILMRLAEQLDSELVNISLGASDYQSRVADSGPYQLSSLCSLFHFPQFVARSASFIWTVIWWSIEIWKPLFDIPLEGKLVAAVGDAGGYGFNSGVLLIG